MKCARCGQEFEQPNFRTDICGSCADSLRDEKEAEISALQAEGEEIARDGV